MRLVRVAASVFLSLALVASCCSAGVVQAFADTLQSEEASAAYVAAQTPDSGASGDVEAPAAASEDSDSPAAGDAEQTDDEGAGVEVDAAGEDEPSGDDAADEEADSAEGDAETDADDSEQGGQAADTDASDDAADSGETAGVADNGESDGGASDGESEADDDAAEAVSQTPRNPSLSVRAIGLRAETVTVSGGVTYAGYDPGHMRSGATVTLYANGKTTGKSVSGVGSGYEGSETPTYSFKNLAKYDSSGKAITYTVKFTDIVGFTKKVSGYNATYTYKFGDAANVGKTILKKEVSSASSTMANANFTFTFNITGRQPSDAPAGSYPYATSDGRTGKIASGGTITLKGGQSVTISNIPQCFYYEWTEGAQPAGWTALDPTCSSAPWGPGYNEIWVDYTGTWTYKSTYTPTAGGIQLTAKKTLSGHTLAKNQFSFELVDSSNTVLQTAKNDADGNISFSKISYGAADVGKTYTYTIREKNEGEAGYTYDAHEETVKVAVSDDGSGNVAANATYDADGANFSNSYAADGSYVQKATVELPGRTLKADEFSFQMKDVAGNVVATGKNAADGSITFSGISFTQSDAGKSFSYKVSQVAGSDSSVSYDASETSVVLTVTDGGSGTLIVSETSGSGNIVFTNALVGRKLSVSKKVDGTDATDVGFVFDVQATLPDGTAYSGAAGDATFADGKASFTLQANQSKALNLPSGTAYTISEQKRAGYAPSFTQGAATGALDADATVEVTNIYTATGTWTPVATKTLLGGTLADGQFDFTLVDESGTEVSHGVCAAGGSVSFDGIDFTGSDVGTTFRYTMSEVKGDDPKVVYDEKEVAVEVTPVDNGDSTLSFTVSYDGATDAPVFTNGYDPTPATVSLTAFKQLDGVRDALEGEFSFVLKDADDQVLQTVCNAADGTVSFEGVEVAQVGTWTYTIFELAGQDVGVTYDDAVVTATVEVSAVVSDAGDKMILQAASASYAGGAGDAGNVFANAFVTPQPAVVSGIQVQTKLVAADDGTEFALQKGEFEFELLDVDGNAVFDTNGKAMKAASQADGTVVFPDLSVPYDAAMEETAVSDADGEPSGARTTALRSADAQDESGFSRVYKVRQVPGDEAGVTYNADEVSITLDATRDKKSNAIVANVSYDGGEGEQKNVLTNLYTASTPALADLAAEKVLEGRTLADGEFSFVLEDANGEAAATTKNAADGGVAFESLSFAHPGTYAYTMREDVGNAEDITYDTTEHAVSVSVAYAADRSLEVAVSYDEGEDVPVFTNTYTAPVVAQASTQEPAATQSANMGKAAASKADTSAPFTGDSAFALRVAIAVAALAAIAALACSLVVRRKQKRAGAGESER